MKQTDAETCKNDHLKRIQEEINEVARRERELREKTKLLQGQLLRNGSSIKCNDHHAVGEGNQECTQENGEEAPSDDSGISASSSPINGSSTNSERKYVRSNGFSTMSPSLPLNSLVRTMSTPQIFQPNRPFSINPLKKGAMQRFIASRGKVGGTQIRKDSGSFNFYQNPALGAQFTSAMNLTPPIIERDADGKPLRKGFVPVEEKIQKELKDLKNRETELKRIRKLRQSQPDLLDSIETESLISEDESDTEHCYPPGKLRASKSISELCDGMSTSMRTTPSPDFERKGQENHQNGMRPAMSLAQLCDLDPDVAPSSHQLIAKWESLIQRNA